RVCPSHATCARFRVYLRVSKLSTAGSNPSQGSVRAVLPRRGWVGWIEEHSKILGAISVWVFVATGGIGALVASASGGHNGTPLSVSSSTPSGRGSSGAMPSNGPTSTGKGGKAGGKTHGPTPGNNGGHGPSSGS